RAFIAACRALGREHDAVISGALRGFPGAGLMAKIRQQPSAPLLALLARRVTRFDPRRVARRTQVARTAIDLMPGVDRPGTRATEHSYWVFPIQAADPDGLVRRLWRHGFDATRGASSMSVVDPPPDRPELEPREARCLEQVARGPASGSTVAGAAGGAAGQGPGALPPGVPRHRGPRPRPACTRGRGAAPGGGRAGRPRDRLGAPTPAAESSSQWR